MTAGVSDDLTSGIAIQTFETFQSYPPFLDHNLWFLYLLIIMLYSVLLDGNTNIASIWSFIEKRTFWNFEKDMKHVMHRSFSIPKDENISVMDKYRIQSLSINAKVSEMSYHIDAD